MPLVDINIMPFEAFNFFVSLPITLAIITVPIAYAIALISDV